MVVLEQAEDVVSVEIERHALPVGEEDFDGGPVDFQAPLTEGSCRTAATCPVSLHTACVASPEAGKSKANANGIVFQRLKLVKRSFIS